MDVDRAGGEDGIERAPAPAASLSEADATAAVGPASEPAPSTGPDQSGAEEAPSIPPPGPPPSSEADAAAARRLAAIDAAAAAAVLAADPTEVELLPRSAVADAALSLVHCLACCTAAAQLVGAGVVQALLPLVGDHDPVHGRIVALAVRALEALVENTAPTAGGAVFRDAGGVTAVADRVVVDVYHKRALLFGRAPPEGGRLLGGAASSAPSGAGPDCFFSGAVKDAATTVAPSTPTPATAPAPAFAGASDAGTVAGDVSGPAADVVLTAGGTVPPTAGLASGAVAGVDAWGDTEDDDERVEVAALSLRGESRALYARLAAACMTAGEAVRYPAPSSSAASRGLLPHSQWGLLRALLRLLSLTSAAAGGSHARELAEGTLPRALRRLLARPFYYGGSLFAAAAATTADIAHAEPTATQLLVDAGVSAALLRSVSLGLPPSGEAVRCVPAALAAVCLCPAALGDVSRAQPLLPYMKRLASPFYGRAMHGDAPMSIGGTLDELVRHVPSLRGDGTAAHVAFLETATSFVVASQAGLFVSPVGEGKVEGAPAVGAPVALSSATVKGTEAVETAMAADGSGSRDLLASVMPPTAAAPVAGEAADRREGARPERHALSRADASLAATVVETSPTLGDLAAGDAKEASRMDTGSGGAKIGREASPSSSPLPAPPFTPHTTLGTAAPGLVLELVALDKMRLTAANLAARLAGLPHSNSDLRSGLMTAGAVERLLSLRRAPALAIVSPAPHGANAAPRLSSAPTAHAVAGAITHALRTLLSAQLPQSVLRVVLRGIFDALREDAIDVLEAVERLDGRGLGGEVLLLFGGNAAHSPPLVFDRDAVVVPSGGGVSSAAVGVAAPAPAAAPTGVQTGAAASPPVAAPPPAVAPPPGTAPPPAAPPPPAAAATPAAAAALAAPSTPATTPRRKMAATADGVPSKQGGKALPPVAPPSPLSHPDALRVLSAAARRLRVSLTFLAGLFSVSRGPSMVVDAWESASGSAIVALVAAADRAVRVLLARSYTGLAVSTADDGDLHSARVSVATDGGQGSMDPAAARLVVSKVTAAANLSPDGAAAVMAAILAASVPSDEPTAGRVELTGASWSLGTLVVANERFFGSLFGNLYAGGRHTSAGRSAARARSMGASIGRSLTLHVSAAEALWTESVATAGGGRISAAWDYLRGVSGLIRECIYDMSRRVTHGAVLQAFLVAGGASLLRRVAKVDTLLAVAAGEVPPQRGREEAPGGVQSLPPPPLPLSRHVPATPFAVAYVAAAKVIVEKRLARSAVGSCDAAPDAAHGPSATGARTAPAVATGVSASMDVTSAQSADAATTSLADLSPADVAAMEAGMAAHAALAATRSSRHVVQGAAMDALAAVVALGSALAVCDELPAGSPAGSAATANEWQPDALHRTAQTLGMQLLADVLTSPPHLLADSTRPALLPALTSSLEAISKSAAADALAARDAAAAVAALSAAAPARGAGNGRRPGAGASGAARAAGSASGPGGSSRARGGEPFLRRMGMLEGSLPDGAAAPAPRSAAASAAAAAAMAAVAPGSQPPPPPPFVPDPTSLSRLVCMGFSSSHATAALQHAAGSRGGIEVALDWLISHPEPEPEADDSGAGRDAPDGGGEATAPTAGTDEGAGDGGASAAAPVPAPAASAPAAGSAGAAPAASAPAAPGVASAAPPRAAPAVAAAAAIPVGPLPTASGTPASGATPSSIPPAATTVGVGVAAGTAASAGAGASDGPVSTAESEAMLSSLALAAGAMETGAHPPAEAASRSAPNAADDEVPVGTTAAAASAASPSPSATAAAGSSNAAAGGGGAVKATPGTAGSSRGKGKALKVVAAAAAPIGVDIDGEVVEPPAHDLDAQCTLALKEAIATESGQLCTALDRRGDGVILSRARYDALLDSCVAVAGGSSRGAAPAVGGAAAVTLGAASRPVGTRSSAAAARGSAAGAGTGSSAAGGSGGPALATAAAAASAASSAAAPTGPTALPRHGSSRSAPGSDVGTSPLPDRPSSRSLAASPLGSLRGRRMMASALSTMIGPPSMSPAPVGNGALLAMEKRPPLSAEVNAAFRKYFLTLLRPVVEHALGGGGTPGTAADAPFIAVELLLVLGRNDALSSGTIRRYADQVVGSLRAFLTAPVAADGPGEEEMAAHLAAKAQTAAVWAHYGSAAVRGALAERGAARAAADYLNGLAAAPPPGLRPRRRSSLGSDALAAAAALVAADPELAGSLPLADAATLGALRRVVVRKAEHARATVCLLTLDAFVRNAKDDHRAAGEAGVAAVRALMPPLPVVPPAVTGADSDEEGAAGGGGGGGRGGGGGSSGEKRKRKRRRGNSAVDVAGGSDVAAGQPPAAPPRDADGDASMAAPSATAAGSASGAPVTAEQPAGNAVPAAAAAAAAPSASVAAAAPSASPAATAPSASAPTTTAASGGSAAKTALPTTAPASGANPKTAPSRDEAVKALTASETTAFNKLRRLLDNANDRKAASVRLAVAETTPFAPPLSLLARVPTAPVASISLSALLDTVVALLPRWASEPTASDVLLALLQLLCSLTEDEDLARRFLAADGVAMLLNLPSMAWPASGCGGVGGPAGGQPPRAVVRSIIRHVAEDKATLEEAMSADVRSLISANRRSSSGYAFTVSVLLTQAAPMIARHIGSLTAAMALSCRLRPAFADTASPTVEAVPDLPLTPAQLADQRRARTNVTRVVEELVRVLAPPPSVAGKAGASAGAPISPSRRGAKGKATDRGKGAKHHAAGAGAVGVAAGAVGVAAGAAAAAPPPTAADGGAPAGAPPPQPLSADGSTPSGRTAGGRGLAAFALRMLTELVELSPTYASAVALARSPVGVAPPAGEEADAGGTPGKSGGLAAVAAAAAGRSASAEDVAMDDEIQPVSRSKPAPPPPLPPPPPAAAARAEARPSALSYVLHELLPMPASPEKAPTPLIRLERAAADETARAARDLFSAMCVRAAAMPQRRDADKAGFKGDGAKGGGGKAGAGAAPAAAAAVAAASPADERTAPFVALAAAAEAEAVRRPAPRVGAVHALAACVPTTPGAVGGVNAGGNTTYLVLRGLLDAGVANALAHCLDRMDVAAAGNADCVNAVLRAVEALGHAASQAAVNAAAVGGGGEGGGGGAGGGHAAAMAHGLHHHHGHGHGRHVHLHRGHPVMGVDGSGMPVTHIPVGVMGGGVPGGGGGIPGGGGLDAMQMGLEGVSRVLDGMLARMGSGADADAAEAAALSGAQVADVHSIVDMLAAQAGEGGGGLGDEEESASEVGEEEEEEEEDEEVEEDEEGLSGDEEGDELEGGGGGGGGGWDEDAPEGGA